MEAKVSRAPMKRLIHWLEAEGIEYEIHAHDRSLTAFDTARAEGVDPRTFAKVVWVRSAHGGDALMVVDFGRSPGLSRRPARCLAQAVPALCPRTRWSP